MHEATAEPSQPYPLPPAPVPVAETPVFQTEEQVNTRSVLLSAPAVSRSRSTWSDILSPNKNAARPRPIFLAGTPSGASASGPARPAVGEKLIVSGEVSVSTDDVSLATSAVRAQALRRGGEIAGETFTGDPEHAQSRLQLRLPPDQVVGFLDWLGGQATIEARNLATQDVSRQAFDQELAIRNLEITMTRLQELAQKPGASLKDVLDVEREMTRVRGDLERLRGEQRGLEDKIARATLAVSIYLKQGLHVEPEMKFELVPALVIFHFVDEGQRAQNRAGAGLSVMFSRWFSLDLQMLPHYQAEARSFLLTAAVQTYSDFLGGGRRRYLNPYLGLRLGGGTINSFGTLAYGADLGVEIVRYRRFVVQMEGRAIGLRYHHPFDPHSDIALEALVGAGVPF